METTATDRFFSRITAIWLIIAGVIGWFAAFQLTQERFHLLENPGSVAGCDFSILVQCSANLESWQGSLFGFPNPILGLSGWIAPIVVGVAILAGAKFPRWFMLTFWTGILLAFIFVAWLISQSIFVLGTLCPWCMVTWAVTIPSFVALTIQLMKNGTFATRCRKIGEALSPYTVLITIGLFAVVILLAQLQLDAINNIIQSL